MVILLQNTDYEQSLLPLKDSQGKQASKHKNHPQHRNVTHMSSHDWVTSVDCELSTCITFQCGRGLQAHSRIRFPQL